MFEKAVLQLSYKRLKNYMTDMLGYSENKAVSTIQALRKTDPRVLRAFILWFYSGEFPKKPLFGVNVGKLSKYRNLDPAVTFLTLDWVAREPEEAKQALSHSYDVVNAKELSDDLEKIMKANGWDIPEAPIPDSEDESDIIVTEDSEKN